LTHRDPVYPLQMLRFLAALAVAFGHAQLMAYWAGVKLGYRIEPWPFPGGAGVDVFFAISGFVMVHAMRGKFGKPGARGEFVRRRLIRIVPPYWLATGALAIWGLLYAPHFDLPTLAASFAFVPYPSLASNGRIVPYLEPGWTLNLEILFYLVFAACLARTAGQTVLRAGAVLLALIAVHGLIAPGLIAPAFWTRPLLAEFVFGMGLGLLRGRLVLPRIVAGAIALTALAALALAPADVSAAGADDWSRVLWYGLPGAALVGAAALADWRVPCAKACDTAGNMSYALYLWHLPVLIFLDRLHGSLSIPVTLWGFVASGLMLSLIAAAVTFYAFERPVLSWLRRRFVDKGSREGHPVSHSA
jgi:peptidoglycan/LPS O-acetylase OafA/YrhL